MVKIVTRLLPLLLILAGCTTMRPEPSETRTPQLSAPELTTQLPSGQRFFITPETSMLRVVLLAEGALARLGHPHVVGGAVIHGELVIADPWQNSAFSLWVPVDELLVDVPEWREDEGFSASLPEGAIEATRRNMLSEGQLDVGNHPFLTIESLKITGPKWQPDVDIRITVAGHRSEWTVPLALDWDTHRIVATGHLQVRLSDLGIEPFSALGGRLKVADEMTVRFRLQALPDGNAQSIGE